MQHMQHILTFLLSLVTSPFKPLWGRLLLLPQNYRDHPSPSPSTSLVSQKTTILSLPPELHLQILSYLDFQSHITLASAHPFFYNMLQFSSLKSKRYWSATFPQIHVLLKDYSVRVTVTNGDFRNAKIEVIALVSKWCDTSYPSNTGKPVLQRKVLVTLDILSKEEKSGMERNEDFTILDDYWLNVPRVTTIPESMDLKKLVVVMAVHTPATRAKKSGEDNRKYWSTQYPFQIARYDPSSSAEPPTRLRTSARGRKAGEPPAEPATLKEMIMFITKKAIKETGLEKAKEVKCTLKVCKLGGTEGYVGFMGDIDVAGTLKEGFWARWFQR